jgi:transposase
MPWTEITRAQYRRDGLRYASDMTEAEWALIARWLPQRRRLGRPRMTDLRRVVEAILYVLTTGCQWRALPRDFPPRSTVQGYFYAWRDTGWWQRTVTALVRQARRGLGRKPRPTAAIIDSQSAPTTQAGGPRGFDAGKRIHGRKRHIVTDTNGLLLAVHVHPANVRIAMEPSLCWSGCDAGSQSCAMSSPTGSTAATSSQPQSPIADRGRSRSWSDRRASRASSCCRDGGSSNAPSPGLVDAAASPRTSKAPLQPKSLGSSSPTSGC